MKLIQYNPPKSAHSVDNSDHTIPAHRHVFWISNSFGKMAIYEWFGFDDFFRNFVEKLLGKIKLVFGEKINILENSAGVNLHHFGAKLDAIFQHQIKKIHCTHDITRKRVTSDGIHPRGLALEQHCSKNVAA